MTNWGRRLCTRLDNWSYPPLLLVVVTTLLLHRHLPPQLHAVRIERLQRERAHVRERVVPRPPDPTPISYSCLFMFISLAWLIVSGDEFKIDGAWGRGGGRFSDGPMFSCCAFLANIAPLMPAVDGGGANVVCTGVYSPAGRGRELFLRVGRQQGMRGAAGGGGRGREGWALLRPARRVRLSAAISWQRATFWDLEEPSSVQAAEMRAPCSELSAM